MDIYIKKLFMFLITIILTVVIMCFVFAYFFLNPNNINRGKYNMDNVVKITEFVSVSRDPDNDTLYDYAFATWNLNYLNILYNNSNDKFYSYFIFHINDSTGIYEYGFLSNVDFVFYNQLNTNYAKKSQIIWSSLVKSNFQQNFYYLYKGPGAENISITNTPGNYFALRADNDDPNKVSLIWISSVPPSSTTSTGQVIQRHNPFDGYIRANHSY